MIIYGKHIEYLTIEFADGSELLIDTEVPHSIFFRFSDFQVDILEVSGEDEEFGFLVLLIETTLCEILISFWCDEDLSNTDHTRSL